MKRNAPPQKNKTINVINYTEGHQMNEHEFQQQLEQFKKRVIPQEVYIYDEESNSTIPVPIEKLEIKDSQELEFIYDETVRKVWNPNEQEWYFSIVDVCQVLTDSENPKNYWNMLKSRLYDIEKQKQDNEISSTRKSQVGSGDRSEKIRTYNQPQGRITDHRIGFSVYQFENFLNGDLDEMIDNLIAADRAEKLKGED